MSGAYGPPFLQQARYCAETLCEDTLSRQAVMTMWERSPRKSLDIPCTVSAHFLIRSGYLHMHVYMRSSDAWLGWPYDIFTFTMMASYIRLMISPRVALGILSVTVGSQHIYTRHCDRARALRPSGDNLVISQYGPNNPGDLLTALGGLVDTPNPRKWSIFS